MKAGIMIFSKAENSGQQLMKLEHESDMTIAEIAQFSSREISDIYSVNENRATVRLVQRSDNLQQSSLSCTRRSDDAYNFAFIHMQINAFQHLATFQKTL
jgi:hypothetical protein